MSSRYKEKGKNATSMNRLLRLASQRERERRLKRTKDQVSSLNKRKSVSLHRVAKPVSIAISTHHHIFFIFLSRVSSFTGQHETQQHDAFASLRKSPVLSWALSSFQRNVAASTFGSHPPTPKYNPHTNLKDGMSLKQPYACLSAEHCMIQCSIVVIVLVTVTSKLLWQAQPGSCKSICLNGLNGSRYALHLPPIRQTVYWLRYSVS